MEAGDVMLGCAASGGPWWMGQHLVTFAGPRLRMLEATYPCPPATKPCSWAHLGILEPLGPNLLWEEGSRDGNWKMVKKAGKWKRTADLHLVQRPQLALCLPLGMAPSFQPLPMSAELSCLSVGAPSTGSITPQMAQGSWETSDCSSDRFLSLGLTVLHLLNRDDTCPDYLIGPRVRALRSGRSWTQGAAR
ncbi:uncharacterized protein [Petaurus breviceps papuanus]|uniref:uncharacterized protein isoform X7 n=1 Tax=Petaurus breviceps papuanus TaxID=3040969 RepID=UPI0036DC7E0C